MFIFDKEITDKNLEIMTTTTNFDSQQFRNMMNTYNALGKYFNGLVIYKGVEIQAKSTRLNGLYEFGQVLDYVKIQSTIHLLIEFCGDSAVWNELVCVTDCKPFNKF